MSEFSGAEFTGERLIPGQVDVDLLNEHMARYAFAARLAGGKRVLDAGCGAGYGSAELARTAFSVAGVDSAAEAIGFARENYRLPNLEFTQGPCEALPYPDGGFDLVVAFEVIEHLAQWRQFLLEVRRVLAPGGQFAVSTPNRLYYTESRGAEGANPFHVHEFDFAEFGAELKLIFPHVSVLLENHVEGVAFQPLEPGQPVEVRVEAGIAAPDESHFFLALCADQPQTGETGFVYVPAAGNVLRERERHIALLERELAAKDEWLERAKGDLTQLHGEHQKQTVELRRSNEWAETLNVQLAERGARIVELQETSLEVSRNYAAKVAELERDVAERTQWAIDTETRLNAAVDQQTAELVRAVEALHRVEKELEERTAWAIQLQQQAAGLEGQLAVYRASRWVSLGRKAGLGPNI